MRASDDGLGAHHISFAYGERQAVCDVSLTVLPQSMLALAGPNGSGKTTLLKLLSGVLLPGYGNVLLGGVPLSTFGARERAQRIAFVAQHTESNLTFSVRHIVSMGRSPHLGFLATLARRDKDAVQGALRATNLDDQAHRPFHELSGGEQQRVMIAMALAQNTDFLLLDEPTVHLDLGHQHAILELLNALRRERGLGIIAVLHDLNLALLYFDALTVLDRGVVRAHGSPADIAADDDALRVFGAPLDVVMHPTAGVPQLLMRRRREP